MHRFSPADEADFRWYLRESDGSFGLRSSYHLVDEFRVLGIVSHLSGGGFDPLSDRALDACARYRRVHGLMRTLPPRARHVIQAQYGATLLPNTWRVFECLAGASQFTEEAQKGLERRRLKTAPNGTDGAFISLDGVWMRTAECAERKPPAKTLCGFPAQRTQSVRWWVEDICAHQIFHRGVDPELPHAINMVAAMRTQALPIYRETVGLWEQAKSHRGEVADVAA